MSDADFDALCDLLDDVHEMRGIPLLSARAKDLFAKAVDIYPWPLIEKGIQALLRDPVEGKYRTPVAPASVIGQIEGAAGQDGRPSADEAWALAVQARDEGATVVWTEEMAAAFATVRTLVEGRDGDTAARMAFRQTYDRLVAEARKDRRLPRWTPSLGTDPARREVAITHAVTAGLLPAPHAQLLLPPPMPDGGPTQSGLEQIAHVKELLATIGSPKNRIIDRRMEANAAERENLQRAKDQIAQQVQHRSQP